MDRLNIQDFDVLFPEAKDDAVAIYLYCFDDREDLLVSQWDLLHYQILYDVGQMIDFTLPKQIKKLLPLSYVEDYIENTTEILNPFVNIALLLLAPSYHKKFINQYYLSTANLVLTRKNNPEFNLAEHRLHMLLLLPQSYFDQLNMKLPYLYYIYKGSPFIPKNEYTRPYTYNMVPTAPAFVDAYILKGRLKYHTSFLDNFIGTFNYQTGEAYSMICGGFVLSCSSDDLYQNIRESDIDIFISGEKEARKKHIRNIINFLLDLGYRFSLIGAVITCVSLEKTSFLIQLINSNFDNPISILDYFDTTYVLMLYDGIDVLCTAKWYKYSPMGFSLINLSNIKVSRIFKCLNKGFVPAINELNKIGVQVSNKKLSSLYYTPEYVVGVDRNIIFTNEVPHIDRTFVNSSDIDIVSTFLDNDTYGNLTSINYSHILDVNLDNVEKAYCYGKIRNYREDRWKLYITNILVPVSAQELLQLRNASVDEVLNVAKNNYTTISDKQLKKKFPPMPYQYYLFLYMYNIDLIPDDNTRHMYGELLYVYQNLRSRETYEELERFIIMNLNKIETSADITIDQLLDYIKYFSVEYSPNFDVSMDEDFNLYIILIAVDIKVTPNIYYESKKIEHISSHAEGIIFLRSEEDDDYLYAYKVWNDKPSFKYRE